MTEDTPTEDDHHHDENLTTSTRERWEYIGTVLAAAVLISLVIVIFGTSAGILSLDGISQAWFTLYATVVLMSATWTFGKGTLEAIQKARGK
jgi:hypothetical protein